jgi:hypothetical protein
MIMTMIPVKIKKNDKLGHAWKATRVEIRPWIRVWTHEIEHAMYVMYIINVCMNQYSRPCCIGYTIRYVWLVWTKIQWLYFQYNTNITV